MVLITVGWGVFFQVRFSEWVAIPNCGSGRPPGGSCCRRAEAPLREGRSLPPCFPPSPVPGFSVGSVTLWPNRLRFLPGTSPHSEFAATSSQQRRRHFLPETKTPLPVRCTFARNRGACDGPQRDYWFSTNFQGGPPCLSCGR